MARRRLVTTPQGDAGLIAHRAHRPIATLVLGHGAGGGIGAPDLRALAASLPRQNVSVLLFEQPWVVAGKRVATSPARLDEAFVHVVSRLRHRSPLVVGGRSAGARVAARTAHRLGAVGCLALAFPLHPPGRPESSRLEELMGSAVPTLVVQGERDAFGKPDEFPESVDMAVIPGADHGFQVASGEPLTRTEALGVVVEACLEWITRDIA
jgi:uncharacterized protein